MSELFESEGGKPLHGYPEDFDGWGRFGEAYIERRDNLFAEEKAKVREEILPLDSTLLSPNIFFLFLFLFLFLKTILRYRVALIMLR